MNEKWIDDIRDRMNEFQQAPPEGLLESARHEVRARKIRRRWLLSVAVASAILAGVFPIAYMIIGIDSVDSSSFLASQTNTPVDVPVNKPENTHVNEPVDIAVNEPENIHVNEPVNIAVNERVQTPQFDNPSSDNDNEQNIKRQTVSSVSTAGKQALSEDINDKESEFMNPETDLPLAYADPVEVNNHSCSTIGVSASVNGLGGLFAANSDAMQNHYAHAGAPPMTRMGGGILAESSSNAHPDPMFMEIFDHKFPLRFSLDYSWPIAHNFEIGSGLTYSYLRSDISCGYSDAPLHHFEQRLHFLGIPIAFRYTPLRIRKIGLYLSAGMMAEKCIGGKIVSKSEDYPDYTYTGSEERPFQFSINIAGGIRYDFNRNYGIYLEPGAGFYLKNGSRLRTIYAERPATFNINIGLRFSH